MNGTKRRRFGVRSQLIPQRFAVPVCLFWCLGGCGGGGGALDQVTGNSGDDTSTVVVTVTDALGSPAIGAFVSLTRERVSRDSTTDALGTATFRSVPEGELSIYARYEAASTTQFGSQNVIVGSGRSEVEVPVRPWPEGVLGVAASTQVSVSPDGRSLEFALRLRYQIGAQELARAGDGGDHDPVPYHMAIESCAPDQTDDVPAVWANCVRGADGFDAPYEVVEVGDPLPVPDRSASSTTSSATLVAMGQSAQMSANDPLDQRLFATKFFLKRKLADSRMALAAFGADGASGDLSPLPRKPVTVFPVDRPAFTTSGTELFPSVDSLEQLEGGKTPTYAAMSALLDFMAAQTLPSERKTLVVLSASADDTCGSASDCNNARTAVIEKSRGVGVALVMVQLNEASESTRDGASVELADGTGGSAFWVDDAGKLAGLFGVLNDVIDGPQEVLQARFRISSSDAAFQSGRTVLGTVQLEDCTYGCWDAGTVPFAVHIP